MCEQSHGPLFRGSCWLLQLAPPIPHCASSVGAAVANEWLECLVLVIRWSSCVGLVRLSLKARVEATGRTLCSDPVYGLLRRIAGWLRHPGAGWMRVVVRLSPAWEMP